MLWIYLLCYLYVILVGKKHSPFPACCIWWGRFSVSGLLYVLLVGKKHPPILRFRPAAPVPERRIGGCFSVPASQLSPCRLRNYYFPVAGVPPLFRFPACCSLFSAVSVLHHSSFCRPADPRIYRQDEPPPLFWGNLLLPLLLSRFGSRPLLLPGVVPRASPYSRGSFSPFSRFAAAVAFFSFAILLLLLFDDSSLFLSCT